MGQASLRLLMIALICLFYSQATPFFAVLADQYPEDWYGLAPMDVNSQNAHNVNFGNTYQITADGQTMTATSQDWTGPSTEDMGVQPITTTSAGKPVTTSVTQYAQFIETTTTQDGKAAVSTSLVVSPKMLSILNNVKDQALASCPKKVKRQTCTLKTIGPDKLAGLLKAAASDEGIDLGAKLVTALVATRLLVEHAEIQLGIGKPAQYKQPVKISVADIPSNTDQAVTSTSSPEPTVTAWVDPIYDGIDALLALSMMAIGPIPNDDGPSLFCSQTATPSPTLVVDRLAAISSGAHFCLDTNGSTFGLGQPFNGTQEDTFDV